MINFPIFSGELLLILLMLFRRKIFIYSTSLSDKFLSRIIDFGFLIDSFFRISNFQSVSGGKNFIIDLVAKAFGWGLNIIFMLETQDNRPQTTLANFLNKFIWSISICAKLLNGLLGSRIKGYRIKILLSIAVFGQNLSNKIRESSNFIKPLRSDLLLGTSTLFSTSIAINSINEELFNE